MSAELPPPAPADRSRHQQVRFADSCGMTGLLRLNIRNLETGEQAKHDLAEPFTLLGRDPACQIQLDDPAVSRRHAYLQVLRGSLHCFDLGSRTGLRFRDGLRIEGILSGTDSLIIGPYQIRLSQAPAYRLHSADDSGPDFENRHTDDVHLAFRNAQGRSSGSGIRQLRERVTLVGSSGRCHVKLSDDSVAPVHASIVRTPVGHWFVNLRPDLTSRLQGEVARCEPLSKDDTLQIGRFKMRFGVGAESPVERPATKRQAQAAADGEEHLSTNGPSIRKSRRRRSRRREDHSASLSEQLVLAALEQFGQMQQQLLGQTHQQSMMLARVIAGMQQEQNAAIYEQIARIQAVTDELVTLRRPRLELNPEIPANITAAGEVVESAPSVDDISDIEVQAEPVPIVSKSQASKEDRREEGVRECDRQASHSSPTRNRKEGPDRAEAYHRVTRRIHELERERSKGWQKVMSLLGVQESDN